MSTSGADVEVWDSVDPDASRPDLADVGGVVLFGSTYNVEHADEQPFIKEVRELTLRGDRPRDPVPRASASARRCWRGRSTPRSARRPDREVGFEPMRPDPPRPTDPLLGHYRDGDMVFQWHMDTFEPPDGRDAARDRRSGAQPGVPRRRPHVGRAVALRDRPARARVLAGRRSAAEGDLVAEWGKRPRTCAPRRTRYLAAHEAEGASCSRASSGWCRRPRGDVSPYRPLIAVVGYHLAPGRVTRWPDGGYGVPAPVPRRAPTSRRARPDREPRRDERPRGDPGAVRRAAVGGRRRRRPAALRRRRRPGAHLRRRTRPGRSSRSSCCSPPTGCGLPDARDLPGDAGDERRVRRHAAPAPARHARAAGARRPDRRHGVDARREAGAREPAARPRPESASLSCSSHHHQGVDRVGDGLVATGWSADGLVEAIERGRGRPVRGTSWMLGVQWHPEDTAADDPAQQAIFDGFALLARWRGSRAKPGETHGRNRAIRPGRTTTPPGRRGSSEEAERIHDAARRPRAPDRPRRLDVGAGLGREADDRHPGVGGGDGPARAHRRSARRRRLRHSIDPIETEHEFLSKGYDDGYPRRVHVHVCQAGSEWERRHLAFRDALRDNPDAAAEYAALKRRLAAEHPATSWPTSTARPRSSGPIEERALADT